MKFTDNFCVKCSRMVNIGCIWASVSCHSNKIYVGSTRIEKLEAVVTPPSKNWH